MCDEHKHVYIPSSIVKMQLFLLTVTCMYSRVRVIQIGWNQEYHSLPKTWITYNHTNNYGVDL